MSDAHFYPPDHDAPPSPLQEEVLALLDNAGIDDGTTKRIMDLIERAEHAMAADADQRRQGC